ncbi:MAG: 30S ribosomal protein S8e [Candidatus Micrarchaeota archaeon]
MEQYHGHSGRKTSGSGGKVRDSYGVKLHEIGGPFTATKCSDINVGVGRRVRGGRTKVKLKKAAHVNVLTEEGMRKVTIRTVVETPDNRHYARKNIITKGAILDTEVGKVKVTNRVGQDGIVNGVPI